MLDDEIIPFLLQRRRCTFFTIDLDFYRRRLCQVCLDVGEYEAAAFARRLLRHSEFDTDAKRMASVIRVSQRGLAVWRLHAEMQIHFDWSL
jgi:hypothetical protein